jgi:hypothetical protein
MLPPNKLTPLAETRSWCVQFSFDPSWSAQLNNILMRTSKRLRLRWPHAVDLSSILARWKQYQETFPVVSRIDSCTSPQISQLLNWVDLVAMCTTKRKVFICNYGSSASSRTRGEVRISFYVRSQNCEKWLLASSCPSVRPSVRNNSAPTGRIFMIFYIWAFFFENLSIQFEFH